MRSDTRRNMTGIFPIRRKTLFNQSINQTNKQSVTTILLTQCEEISALEFQSHVNFASDVVVTLFISY